MKPATRGLCFLLPAAALVACSEPDQPANVTVAPGKVSFDAASASQQLNATVTDTKGKVIQSAMVTWSSSDDAVATVSSSGLVTAVGNGAAVVKAAAGEISGSADVTVEQVATTVEATAGQQQAATVASVLPQQLVVRARDRLDKPVVGTAVTLTVSANGGTVNPSTGTTDADGQFATTWTLGTTAGTFQVNVAIAATSKGLTFTATAMPGPPFALSRVGGDNQFGFMGTRLAQPIAVKVRDQYGNGIPSYLVQFATPFGDGTPDSSVANTDSLGVARTGWVMPGTAIDTVTLTATATDASSNALVGSPLGFTAVSHNVSVTGVSPSPMVEGQPVTLTGTGFDAGNTQNAVTVDGTSAVVTTASGTQLTITAPTFDCQPARPAAVQVTVGGIPAAQRPDSVTPAAFLNLALGKEQLITNPAQFCLQFPKTSASESYLVGVQSASEDVTQLTPIGLFGTAPGAAASPVIASLSSPTARQVAPINLERLARLRRHAVVEASILEAGRRFAAAHRGLSLAAPGVKAAPQAVVTGSESIGDTIRIRMTKSGNCGPADTVSIKTYVRQVGNNAVFLEDSANAAYLQSADFQSFSTGWDGTLFAADTAEFGQPSDHDGNSRVVVVISKEVNKVGALGFTASCDFFARTDQNAASNEGEFFYLLSPDPNARYGPAYPVAQARKDIPVTMTHEMTHVIQIGRRGTFPTIWIAEGQALMGEERGGFATLGLHRGNEYGLAEALGDTASTDWFSDRFVGLGLYFGWNPFSNNGDGRLFTAPHECSWLDQAPVNPGPCVAGLDVYGTPWSLLRWISDRFAVDSAAEATLQRALITGPEGYAALEAVTGKPIDSLLAQWAAMLYLDDGPGGTIDQTLTMSTWDFQDVYYGTTDIDGSTVALRDALRLMPARRGFATFADSVNVRAGSSYYALVSGDGRPATAIKARTRAGGALPSHMRMWVVRVQ